MPITSTSLLICHSAGDTNASIEAARALPPHERIFIFSIGLVAKKMLSNTHLNSHISLIHADEILSGQRGDYEDGAFTPAQLQIIQDYLRSLKADRVLIGTPSKSHATTYLQIAEYFANDSTVVYRAILNDYLFEEPEHSYWLKLRLLAKAPTELLWLFNYCWLTPLPEVSNRIHRISPQLQTSIVGHTIFNQSIPVDVFHIREQLNLQPDEPFLLFSGSKVAHDDLELIQEIFSKMQSHAHQHVKMIIGLHPGMENIAVYLNQLSELITNSHLEGRVKYIISNAIFNNLGESSSNARDTIHANLSGNDVAKASNGVASVLPATLANQAYLDGLPVYIARDIEKAYLFSNYDNDLESFLSKVAHQEKSTLNIEGIPSDTIGEAVAQTGLRR